MRVPRIGPGSSRGDTPYEPHQHERPVPDRQRNLGINNQAVATLERLSTGLHHARQGRPRRPHRVRESAFRGGRHGQAIKNAERADQVANIAEGGPRRSPALTEVQALVTQAANDGGVSAAEKQANQLQIDSILQTIDRVAAATSFQGIKLLNGNFDYTVDGVDPDIAAFAVNGAKLTYQGDRDVTVQVTQSAQVGSLFLSFGGAALDLTDALSRFVIEVGGIEGSRELSFSSGTSLAVFADTINTFTDVTGVSATVSGDGVRLDSVAFGSNEFVGVRVVDDGGAVGGGVYRMFDQDNNTANTAGGVTFTNAANRVLDYGQNLGATINGINATTSGKIARINTDFLDVELELTTIAAQQLGNIDAFTITGGGADFQLAGIVNIGNKVSIGIANVASRELGATRTPRATSTSSPTSAPVAN